jgi:hypothetical protein
MKRRLSYVFGLIVLGTLAFTTLAHAQTTSAGPYYATPSWDQQLPASTRFIVLSNWNSSAVLDRETGLVWEQSPSTASFPWTRDAAASGTLTAAEHCATLSVGNRKGWRLPTIQELASLLDPSQSSPGPFLPTGHPFSNVVGVNRVLSATISSIDTNTVWFVSLSGGGVGDLGPKTEQDRVWCVRGGQGADSQ